MQKLVCYIYNAQRNAERTKQRTQTDVHFLLQKLIMKNERQLESNDSGLALFS
jgi:hypothetical protein